MDNVAVDPLPFAPDSVIRRVNREPVLLLGGRAALLMQLAHPLVAAGVAHHSGFRDDPLGRLRRTLTTISVMVYGTEPEARSAARHVNAVHSTVRGIDDDGRAYSAMQPDLLLWVFSTLVDCALSVYEPFVAPLSHEERCGFYEESKTLARMFGVPARTLPATIDQLRDWMRERIDTGEVRVTPLARDLARPILSPISWVPWWATSRSLPIVAWLLPTELRKGYGIHLGRSGRAAVAALQRASTLVIPRSPPVIKRIALRAVF
jgi:uncharacterized protein (DUF2236 family)